MSFLPLVVRRLSRPFQLATRRSCHIDTLPERIDWREKGVIPPVKDQGSEAGACWAFAAVGAVEALHAIKTGVLVLLSEQDLIDYHAKTGGFVEIGFDFIMKNGVHRAVDYPFTGVIGKWDRDKITGPLVSIDSYGEVQPFNEQALKEAVSRQPICASVNEEHPFVSYTKEGLIKQRTIYPSSHYLKFGGVDLTHSVLIVGYGSDETGDYWLIRNSYGPRWGDDGYTKIPRNVANPEGSCGITLDLLYPIMNSLDKVPPLPTLCNKVVTVPVLNPQTQPTMNDRRIVGSLFATGTPIQGYGDVKELLLPDVTPLSQALPTAADKQMATDNKIVGELELIGIPPTPRGMPQIEVTFHIHTNGILTVSAKTTSHEEQQINITIRSSGGLSEDEIQKMAGEAELHSQKELMKSLIPVMNIIDTTVCNIEKAFSRDNLPSEVISETKAAVSDLMSAVGVGNDGDIKAKLDAANKAVSKIEQHVTEKHMAGSSDGGSS